MCFRVSLNVFLLLCCSVMLFGFSFQCQAKRLAGKNVSDMSYFVSNGRKL